jgi:hypothetical protein
VTQVSRAAKTTPAQRVVFACLAYATNGELMARHVVFVRVLGKRPAILEMLASMVYALNVVKMMKCAACPKAQGRKLVMLEICA